MAKAETDGGKISFKTMAPFMQSNRSLALATQQLRAELAIRDRQIEQLEMANIRLREHIAELEGADDQRRIEMLANQRLRRKVKAIRTASLRSIAALERFVAVIDANSSNGDEELLASSTQLFNKQQHSPLLRDRASPMETVVEASELSPSIGFSREDNRKCFGGSSGSSSSSKSVIEHPYPRTKEKISPKRSDANNHMKGIDATLIPKRRRMMKHPVTTEQMMLDESDENDDPRRGFADGIDDAESMRLSAAAALIARESHPFVTDRSKRRTKSNGRDRGDHDRGDRHSNDNEHETAVIHLLDNIALKSLPSSPTAAAVAITNNNSANSTSSSSSSSIGSSRFGHENSTSMERSFSGRPLRAAVMKVSSYKEPNNTVKLRRNS